MTAVVADTLVGVETGFELASPPVEIEWGHAVARAVSSYFDAQLTAGASTMLPGEWTGTMTTSVMNDTAGVVEILAGLGPLLSLPLEFTSVTFAVLGDGVLSLEVLSSLSADGSLVLDVGTTVQGDVAYELEWTGVSTPPTLVSLGKLLGTVRVRFLGLGLKI